ncbi:hypothetical protein [Aurantiacibacter atlanticus]|uniref:hypothetical protein n=1 Tax=Aurantiacibacter atlanticus TaxID=1648404 RepID=UPI00065F3A7F
MFLQNAFKHIFSARVIPDTIWQHERDGPRLADLQTIDLAALETAAIGAFGPYKAQFLHPPLEIAPRTVANLVLAALLLVRHAAQENMLFDALAINLGKSRFGFDDFLAFGQRFFPAIRAISALT